MRQKAGKTAPQRRVPVPSHWTEHGARCKACKCSKQALRQLGYMNCASWLPSCCGCRDFWSEVCELSCVLCPGCNSHREDVGTRLSIEKACVPRFQVHLGYCCGAGTVRSRPRRADLLLDPFDISPLKPDDALSCCRANDTFRKPEKCCCIRLMLLYAITCLLLMCVIVHGM